MKLQLLIHNYMHKCFETFKLQYAEETKMRPMMNSARIPLKRNQKRVMKALICLITQTYDLNKKKYTNLICKRKYVSGIFPTSL